MKHAGGSQGPPAFCFITRHPLVEKSKQPERFFSFRLLLLKQWWPYANIQVNDLIPLGFVNEINAGVGQLGELFQIVAAVNDAGVEQGRGF